ncbi:MAG: phosphohydrolase [Treponema sp.]|jgi:metal-dependent HD superfamily phosphatase/phosphodiesterase|nr:phosphohydrolase [Treponema sp.]
MKSPKELNLNTNLINTVSSFSLSGKALDALKWILENEEIQAAQEYANTVSIIRLGYNDHGPVHMRTVTYNAVIMLDLLRKAGIKTSLEADGCGDFEDSLLSVIIASMFHDLGMGMGRQDHELHSTIIALPFINDLLSRIYGNNYFKKIMIQDMALEGIRGHMGSINVSSLEAGIVLIADGCDMKKGRARIPIALGHAPKVGQIHQYSANSIEEVRISAGMEKPIRIDVHMSSEVGLFQVEEVLMHKISASTAKGHVELYAQVINETEKRYL